MYAHVYKHTLMWVCPNSDGDKAYFIFFSSLIPLFVTITTHKYVLDFFHCEE